jgi:hypothetical protein
VWKRLKLGDSATDPCGIQFYVPTNVDVVAQARNGPIGAGVGADAVVTFTSRANACNGIVVLAAGSLTTGHGSLLLQTCRDWRMFSPSRRDTGGEKARAARSALLCSSSPLWEVGTGHLGRPSAWVLPAVNLGPSTDILLDLQPQAGRQGFLREFGSDSETPTKPLHLDLSDGRSIRPLRTLHPHPHLRKDQGVAPCAIRCPARLPRVRTAWDRGP